MEMTRGRRDWSAVPASATTARDSHGFLHKKFAFCLNGNLLGGPFSFPAGGTNILTRGSLVVYARPDTPQLHKTSFKAHDDNFSITTLSASQTCSQLRLNARASSRVSSKRAPRMKSWRHVRVGADKPGNRGAAIEGSHCGPGYLWVNDKPGGAAAPPGRLD
jgi:hypothetical protein